MKEYTFDVTISFGVSIGADTEKEAREKLTDQTAEYFAETTIEIDEKEAKLVSVGTI